VRWGRVQTRMGGRAAGPGAGAGSRRAVVLGVGVAAGGLLLPPRPPARAAQGGAFGRVWGAVTRTKGDIAYPAGFEGCWDVQGRLESLDTPMGLDVVPDARQIERARREDLGQTLSYRQCFTKNAEGAVVADRARNTLLLAEATAGPLPGAEVDWDIDRPNVLSVRLQGSTSYTVTVTKRYEGDVDEEAQRLSTSEFFKQVADVPGRNTPAVKASRLLTKWKWRDRAPEAQPLIVATQVLTDFVVPAEGDEELLLRSQGRPVAVWTYKLAFFPPAEAAPAAPA